MDVNISKLWPIVVLTFLNLSLVSCLQGEFGEPEASKKSSSTEAIVPGSGDSDNENPPPAAPFLWVKGLDVSNIPSFSRPLLNSSFIDSVFGLKISRVTEASQVTDRDVPAWVRHEYSRRPAFNADGSFALMYSSNGWYRLYRVASDQSMSFVKTLPFGGSVEPNWHPTDPDLVYHFEPYGLDMKISEYKVSTSASRVVRDFKDRVKAIFPTAARAWTKEEGRPSDDGKIWCLQVEATDYSILGLVSYNFETDTILGSMTTDSRPDHISTSPSGNHCVPSWAFEPAKGTRAYSLDFSIDTQLFNQSEHSDLSTSRSGKDAYVFFDYNAGEVAMVEYETSGATISTQRTKLFDIYGANNSAVAGHISGTTKLKPGYAVVSFYACTENYGAESCEDSQWTKDKIFIVNLRSDFDPSRDLYNLAHNHYGNAGYFSEPQAVASFDLTKVLFVSTWGSAVEADLSSYLIEVPATSLPDSP